METCDGPLPNQERDMIKKTVEQAECEDGAVYFLVSVAWWDQWKRYSQSIDGATKPGVIDNSTLLDSEQHLQKDLEEDFHFHLLPQAAWDLFMLW